MEINDGRIRIKTHTSVMASFPEPGDGPAALSMPLQGDLISTQMHSALWHWGGSLQNRNIRLSNGPESPTTVLEISKRIPVTSSYHLHTPRKLLPDGSHLGQNSCAYLCGCFVCCVYNNSDSYVCLLICNTL